MISRNGKHFFHGDLDLRGRDDFQIPDHLMVFGDLNIEGSNRTSLPKDLWVGECLRAADSRLESLPEDIWVGVSSDISRTPIKSLSENTKFGKALIAKEMNIRLPENFKVLTVLDLEGYRGEYLPKGMCVGKYMDIRNSNIKELPGGLVVLGDLIAVNSKIEKIGEGVIIKGYCNLLNTPIKELPDSFKPHSLDCDMKIVTPFVPRDRTIPFSTRRQDNFEITRQRMNESWNKVMSPYRKFLNKTKK